MTMPDGMMSDRQIKLYIERFTWASTYAFTFQREFTAEELATKEEFRTKGLPREAATPVVPELIQQLFYTKPGTQTKLPFTPVKRAKVVENV
jgi:hypothetical protein